MPSSNVLVNSLDICIFQCQNSNHQCTIAFMCTVCCRFEFCSAEFLITAESQIDCVAHDDISFLFDRETLFDPLNGSMIQVQFIRFIIMI